jgi:hypothetical protein
MTEQGDQRIYAAIDVHDHRGLRSQLRVVAVKWKGRYRIHIRDFYLGEDGTFFAGRGIAIWPEMLDRVIYGLELARDDYREGRLSDDEFLVKPPETGV